MEQKDLWFRSWAYQIGHAAVVNGLPQLRRISSKGTVLYGRNDAELSPATSLPALRNTVNIRGGVEDTRLEAKAKDT